jgi:hypothetical protein
MNLPHDLLKTAFPLDAQAVDQRGRVVVKVRFFDSAPNREDKVGSFHELSCEHGVELCLGPALVC